MLEGLVHRVIAQLFALSGQLGLGVFMRESVLVRLGVVRQRFVFMRFSGEDDDGIRGDVVWTRSYQRRGHRSDCGLGACAGAWQIWERGWFMVAFAYLGCPLWSWESSPLEPAGFAAW